MGNDEGAVDAAVSDDPYEEPSEDGEAAGSRQRPPPASSWEGCSRGLYRELRRSGRE